MKKKVLGDIYWPLRISDATMLFMVLLAAFAAMTATAGIFDENSLDAVTNQFFDSIHGTFLDRVMYGVTLAGGPVSVVMIMFVIVVFLGRRNAWLDAAVVVLSVGGAEIVKEIVKSLIGRARPANAMIAIDGFSFPSGHATASAAIAVIFVFVIGKHLKGKARTAGELFGVAYAVLVGFSRIYLNVHWLSDVIGGFLLGSAWTLGVMISSYPIYKTQKKKLEG